MGLILAVVSSTAQAALADDGACQGQSPLLFEVEAGEVRLEGESVWGGDWRIPGSVARTRLHFVPSRKKGQWLAQLDFTFFDSENAYGIPFTFQKADLDWKTEDGKKHTAQIDWSNSCQNMGKSIYPGQAWFGVFKLSEPPNGTVMREVILRVWGSRN